MIAQCCVLVLDVQDQHKKRTSNPQVESLVGRSESFLIESENSSEQNCIPVRPRAINQTLLIVESDSYRR